MAVDQASADTKLAEQPPVRRTAAACTLPSHAWSGACAIRLFHLLRRKGVSPHPLFGEGGGQQSSAGERAAANEMGDIGSLATII